MHTGPDAPAPPETAEPDAPKPAEGPSEPAPETQDDSWVPDEKPPAPPPAEATFDMDDVDDEEF